MSFLHLREQTFLWTGKEQGMMRHNDNVIIYGGNHQWYKIGPQLPKLMGICAIDHLAYNYNTWCIIYSCSCMSWSTSWWRHQMETFSVLLALCAGNSPVPGELPAQRPVTRSFDGFFDLRRNKLLSKQWWGWWFETLSNPLWRHCNVSVKSTINSSWT